MSEEEVQTKIQSPVIKTDESEQQVKLTEITSHEPQETQQVREEYTSDIWLTTDQDVAFSTVLQQHSMQLNQDNNDTAPVEQPNQVISTPTPTPTPAQEMAVPVVAEQEVEKPAVGSEEWHKQRRENHKQVERRRRETINEGILEISRIVPGCEKNKGSILQRAAVYIRQLKEAEAATVEKWTLEKLLTDQAISELNRQVEVLKSELERSRLECTYLKRELDNVHLHHSNPDKQPDIKKQKLNHEE